MNEFRITIAAPELAAAINNLAAVLGSNAPTTSAPTPAQDTTPAPIPVPLAPVSAPTPALPAENVTLPSVVPTSAPQYTLEMIATAGSSLIDAGKLDQLMGLLGKFGVASLTELSPDSYGAMAGELRAMGATI